jgi:hypothetical protein
MRAVSLQDECRKPKRIFAHKFDRDCALFPVARTVLMIAHKMDEPAHNFKGRDIMTVIKCISFR